MTLSEELQWRGQIKDTTFTDINWLNDPKTFYLGSDCSSDSLTIGNLAIYMLARRLHKHGWKTIMLVGGATSLIGDPGGKESERDLKTKETIEANVRGIQAQVNKLINTTDYELVNNYDWFSGIGYLDFLRDVGKHFSMTELLQRDFIASRLGDGNAGISYAEFSYSLIQGYDYWHLHKNHGAVLQIGGSDQWGNMLSGVPLIRKKEGTEVHALSMPLVINKTTGKKFGKSEDGAIWLDPTKTSPYTFYQFWLNVDDEGVEDYLKIYTDLDKQTINTLMATHADTPHMRKAQKMLAQAVTAIVHSEDIVQSVLEMTDIVFGKSDNINQDTAALIANEVKTIEVNTLNELDLPQIIVDLELASSKGEARKFIEAGAIKAGLPADKLALGEDLTPKLTHGIVLIRRGKNAIAALKLA